MYPNEDIANGLRIEYTALDEPFVTELLLNSKNFKASTNLLDAILFSNIIFIIVRQNIINFIFCLIINQYNFNCISFNE